MVARLVGALVFLALIGFAVASPVLFGKDGPRDPVVESPAPAPTPRGLATPTPEPEPSREPFARRLLERYPRACLRPVARPGSFGLVAAYRDGTITIATTGGEVQATIRAPGRIVRPPLAWSPSGTILAAGPQGLFWRPDGNEVFVGDVQHGLVQGRRGTWGWSPLSDCGVHIDEAGALYVAAANPNVVGAGRELLDDGVESFSFSPDGRMLGLVLTDERVRTIWVADLVTSRLHLVRDFPQPLCCISLGGWSPAGDELMYWAGSGNSVMADGWPLESVGLDGARNRWAETIPSGPLARCRDELVGLVGGDRFGDGARLAEIRPGGREIMLTEPSDQATSFSCSPDDRFLVVQTDSRLALLDRDGDFVRYLTDVDTPNGQWSESNPEWGPPRTGIIFVRGSDLQTQLWFVPEGGTEHAVMDLSSSGRWNLRSLFDWSATPPTGFPSG